MPKADPRKSPYCASRHLLRHLNDARELRRNPLAASWFRTHNMSRSRPPNEDRDALLYTKGRVFSALDGIFRDAHAGISFRDATRAHVVLLRCELQGQSRRVVAEELGISLRRLQSARTLGHRLFLESLRRVQAPIQLCASRGNLAIEEALELTERGEPRAALETLKAIGKGLSDRATVVEALCEQADIELRAFALERIAELLERARTIAQHLAGDEALQRLAACRIGFAQAKVDRFTGQVDAAGLPPTLKTSLDRIGAPGNRSTALLLVRLLTLSIDCHTELGLFADARCAAERATKLLASLDLQSGILPFELLMATTRLEAVVYQDINSIINSYREASRTAELRGYAGAALRANACLATVELVAGTISFRSFTTRGKLLLREAEDRKKVLDHTRLVVVDQLCDGSAVAGRPEPTLALVDRLAAIAPPKSYDASFVPIYRSVALAKAGRHAEAEEAAAERVENSRRLRSPRLLAGAELFLAINMAERGRPRLAYQQLDQAFPLLSRYGTGWALNQAETLRRQLEAKRSRIFPAMA